MKSSTFDMKFTNTSCKMVNYKHNKWISSVVTCIGPSCEPPRLPGHSGGGGRESMLLHHRALCGYPLWRPHPEDWKQLQGVHVSYSPIKHRYYMYIYSRSQQDIYVRSIFIDLLWFISRAELAVLWLYSIN